MSQCPGFRWGKSKVLRHLRDRSNDTSFAPGASAIHMQTHTRTSKRAATMMQTEITTEIIGVKETEQAHSQTQQRAMGDSPPQNVLMRTQG